MFVCLGARSRGQLAASQKKSVQAAEKNYSQAATPWKPLPSDRIKKELDLGEPANVRKGQGGHLCQLKACIAHSPRRQIPTTNMSPYLPKPLPPRIPGEHKGAGAGCRVIGSRIQQHTEIPFFVVSASIFKDVSETYGFLQRHKGANDCPGMPRVLNMGSLQLQCRTRTAIHIRCQLKRAFVDN